MALPQVHLAHAAINRRVRLSHGKMSRKSALTSSAASLALRREINLLMEEKAIYWTSENIARPGVGPIVLEYAIALRLVLLLVGHVKMSAAKLSISLPESLTGFVESYRKRRGLNRSQVFEEAVRLLRSRELEAAYRESAAKPDSAWDGAITDGLEDEAW